MPPPQRDRPLNDTECDRIHTALSRFRSESAMKNLEEIDGFFAALICSPELAKPSEYLPEIWGGEMADDEAFADQQGAQDFLSLLFRHWNSIGGKLEGEDPRREPEGSLPLLHGRVARDAGKEGRQAYPRRVDGGHDGVPYCRCQLCRGEVYE
jgi:hypothetical protein